MRKHKKYAQISKKKAKKKNFCTFLLFFFYFYSMHPQQTKKMREKKFTHKLTKKIQTKKRKMQ